MNDTSRKLLGVLIFAVGLALALSSCDWTLARKDEVAKEQKELICFQDGKKEPMLSILADDVILRGGVIEITAPQGVKGTSAEVVPGAAVCVIVNGTDKLKATPRVELPQVDLPKAPRVSSVDAGPPTGDAGPIPTAPPTR